MLELVVVFIIIGVSIFYMGKRLYNQFTSNNTGCGCGCEKECPVGKKDLRREFLK